MDGERASHECEPMADWLPRSSRAADVVDVGGVKRRVWRVGVLKVPTMKSMVLKST